MLAQRLIVAIIFIPIGVWIVTVGGWLLAVVLAAALAFAAWEYFRMYQKGGYDPSAPVLIAGTAGLVLARQAAHQSTESLTAGTAGLSSAPLLDSGMLFSLFILLAMAVQVVHFEKGQKTSALDFNITLGGILYLGWLGSYLVSLRNLPDGLWWFLLVLPASWLTDGAGYFIGRRFGRHKISKRVSPNKSWEGYIGGIAAAALGTMLLAALWNTRTPLITVEKGLILGLVVAIISPLGDLGESMLKRGFGVKDSSRILPGHGGIMDRIDSWLWAGTICYYIILFAWV